MTIKKINDKLSSILEDFFIVNKLLWVIQNGFKYEPGFQNFIETLQRMELEYVFVNYNSTEKTVEVVDRNGKPTGNFLPNQINRKAIVIGGYGLSYFAKNNLWFPGSFINDNFEYNKWIEHYGKDEMLNGNAIITTVDNALMPNGVDKIFIRPLEDSKSFSGGIYTREEFEDFKDKAIHGKTNSLILTKDTQIVISEIVKIHIEARFFVVNEKIVAKSIYKRGNSVVYDRDVDPFLVDYAEQMVAKWMPCKAFVIDIADTEIGTKIVELNNINSAGIYDADSFSIISAMEDFLTEKSPVSTPE